MSTLTVRKGAGAPRDLLDGANLSAPAVVIPIPIPIPRGRGINTGADPDDKGKVFRPPVRLVIDQTSSILTVDPHPEHSAAKERIIGTNPIEAIINHLKLVLAGRETPLPRIHCIIGVIGIW
eukprot:CAMPEP_0196231562 /NCGR_PEP_ID=MMETSP0913-20130531/2299_1 /TAXON_ID=49265 /ORGANISM="Thalassiosira rotula, Strain GSO102" /LENGTH=121 /DNA_ID=CAMNT_0041511739 /DNA_START=988 /DNA_END=1350 /DNA_ORIENTATION=+